MSRQEQGAGAQPPEGGGGAEGRTGGRAEALAAWAVPVVGDPARPRREADSGAAALSQAESRLRDLAERVVSGDRAAACEAHDLLHELADAVRARIEGLSGDHGPALSPGDRAVRLERAIGIEPVEHGASGNKGKGRAADQRRREAAVVACWTIEQRQQWPNGERYEAGGGTADPDSSRMHTDVARRVTELYGGEVSGSTVRKWYGTWCRDGCPALPQSAWGAQADSPWHGWWIEVVEPKAEAWAEIEAEARRAGELG